MKVTNDSRLQGLEADLGMTGNDYNIALCILFATFLSNNVHY